MNMRRLAVLFSLAGMVAGVLVSLSLSPAHATFPGGNGLILFNRGGDLYTATATGGSVMRLTTVGGIGGAKWSPDGTRIAYSRSGSVYVRNIETGRTVRVAGAQGVAQWSPDGARLAFLARPNPAGPCDQPAIYSVPANGGTPRLDHTPGYENLCGERGTHIYTLGTYTPSGSILLTVCHSWGGSACWIDEASMDGSDSTRMITAIVCEQEARFPRDGSPAKCNDMLHLSDARIGPDGEALMFSGKGGHLPTLPGSTPLPTSSTPEKVYTVDVTGADRHSVSTATSGHSPTTSPDGRAALFTQRINGVNTIVKASGTSATATASVLIKNAGQADWQPVP